MDVGTREGEGEGGRAGEGGRVDETRRGGEGDRLALCYFAYNQRPGAD